MRRMGRVARIWCLIVLVTSQAVSGPLASAMGGTVAHDGCDHGTTVHAWHATDACGDHEQTPGGARPADHRADSNGRCHCVHVWIQAQGTSSLVAIVAPSMQSALLAGEPEDSAHPAPVFELLRPPN